MGDTIDVDSLNQFIKIQPITLAWPARCCAVFLPCLPDEIKNSTESWVKCVAGADNIDIYINRLEKTGFSSVTIEEEKLYSTEPGMENLRSMLIRALKN